MIDRHRLLDLFCGAGGASAGYRKAGFHVTGVDMKDQPRHMGDHFIQADALEYLAAHGHEYDAIHASPPCQGYSIMWNLPWLRGREYPRLIKPVRDLLISVGKPWVVENVLGAKWGCKNLRNISEIIGEDITDHGMKAPFLCGTHFGLPFYRHRLFETDWLLMVPPHQKHKLPVRRGTFPERNPAVGTGGQYNERQYTRKSGKVETTEATSTSAPRLRGGGVRRYKRIDAYYGSPVEGIVKPPIGKSRGKVENLGMGVGTDPNYLVNEKGKRNKVNSKWIETHNGTKEPRARDGSLARWQGNGAQAEGVGVGHAAGWRIAAEAMGIWWMKRDELTQAIPPCYTEFIGRQLIAQI